MDDRIVFDQRGEVGDLISTQDRANMDHFVGILRQPVRERNKQLARQRETYCRELLEAKMPHRLHWVIDRPRLLKRVLRFVPSWRPTLTRNAPSAMPTTTAEGASALLATWTRELEAAGHEARGIVFNYTDVEGLPAEIYGPVR